ncbi:phosphohistidine phosphatase SixA [Pasteurellaceae bacterium Macca]|nr:phosphohistidine phosphatase SixA [Pasteurellaceae bacterium Macca]
MKIWVMRHGEAGFNAKTDRERSLTTQGEKMAFEQGQILGKRFENQQVSLDKILVSPYLRAQQTADFVQKGLQAVNFVQSFANLRENWAGITPSGDPENVLNYLHFLHEEGAKNVLIISHLPLVFDLVQALTSDAHTVHFYPAVVAEVEWNGNTGQLLHVFA